MANEAPPNGLLEARAEAVEHDAVDEGGLTDAAVPDEDDFDAFVHFENEAKLTGIGRTNQAPEHD
jgi:hypothetical protein